MAKLSPLDRIGKEGAIFTDHFAQPACTAGRAAFITGQLPIRSGMTPVGHTAGPLGLKHETVTLAEILRTQAARPVNSGKTILETETSISRQCTASTSFSATSTI